ncbi:hypothetical protein Ahy_A10g047772 [Arachis hypogaea]|uniref:Aminotransferase-like plant mobile domain-containing protein n=1 Tax=Arachis hypogaea TaxID=3818 RepID=A0A445B3E9_ARAHY|nr:hypothetical protein Ahy_A10g047772 [Arachis hypogaea]
MEDDPNRIYRLDGVAHIGAHRCISSMRRQHGMPLHDERIMPYIQMAGLAHLARLNDRWFRLDEPLVSAFMERCRSETHTFHMPFGECMITLQDVAYHLRLPIDGQCVSSCLMDFERYIEGGRPAWTCSLGTSLVHARMRIRWLPYVVILEDMGGYSWGSAALSWLYRCLCRVANKNVPTSSEKGPRIAHCRLHIDLLRPGDFVWMSYSSPDVMQVVHPEILESRHTALWISTTSLIYFAVIEWHQVWIGFYLSLEEYSIGRCPN